MYAFCIYAVLFFNQVWIWFVALCSFAPLRRSEDATRFRINNLHIMSSPIRLADVSRVLSQHADELGGQHVRGFHADWQSSARIYRSCSSLFELGDLNFFKRLWAPLSDAF